MEIKEKIESCKEIANDERNAVEALVSMLEKDDNGSSAYKNISNHIRFAEENEKVAKWLEELEAYREIGSVGELKNLTLQIERAYNKALNDIDIVITEKLDESNNHVECQTLRWVLDVISSFVI